MDADNAYSDSTTLSLTVADGIDPTITSCSYSATHNTLQFVFSTPVQFDQIAEDRSVDGGSGNDELNGGAGNDSISGGDGIDRIAGNEGNDILLGGAGNDVIVGDDGADTITGGSGIDVIAGGDGSFFFQIY